jgi:hypothetical protein
MRKREEILMAIIEGQPHFMKYRNIFLIKVADLNELYIYVMMSNKKQTPWF